MKADAVALACSVGQSVQDVIFSYCPTPAGNVWSVIFFPSTCHKIPMHSLLADQQTTPAQPC